MARSELGDRFRDALVFAAAHHRGQRRKVTDVPYLGHLLGVAALVIDDGGSEDEAIAALLHDAIEDAADPAATRAEIAARFGPEVTGIVVACSDSLAQPKAPWRERKAAFLATLPALDPAARRVVVADKLHNARALLAELRRDGAAVLDRFHGGHDGTLWYYRAVCDGLTGAAPGPLVDELARTVAEIEQLAGR